MANLIRPLILIIGPVESCSGYGAHARDISNSIIQLYADTHEILIHAINWGISPTTALKSGYYPEITSRIISTQLNRQPDMLICISVPQEFNPIGKLNIGVTAGTETTISPMNMIEGLNRMDFNIVPSEFNQKVFMDTSYMLADKATNIPTTMLKVEKPLEVLFEGVDTKIYYKIEDKDYDHTLVPELDEIEEDFLFLVSGHWLQGDLGHDRKDIGMSIKTFLDAFAGAPKKPGLLLKVSEGTYSHMDYQSIVKKIEYIKNMMPTKDVPNIYLLHGDLTDIQINSLYNHPKVKALYSLTHGESWGRPLMEFSMTGKPIIASGFSGHLDFLDKELTVLLPGTLQEIHPSAVNEFLVQNSKWFVADYEIAKKYLIDVFLNYAKYKKLSAKQGYNGKVHFNLDKMTAKLKQIIDRYKKEYPDEYELQMPVKKITLPTIKQVNTEVSDAK